MSSTPAPDPLGHLADDLAQVRAQGLYRPLRVMSSANRTRVIVDGREAITLASNNYLGLNTHPRLIEAALDAVRRFGAGSGAVRTIAGTMSLHEELEAELARFKHVEATLTFQSGFTCNTGVIPVVAAEPDLIVSDAFNHASIIDGMRLSKAPRVIYRHKDVAHLRELLATARREGRPDGQPYRAILVVTDGVFSMDGDIAPLPGDRGRGRGAWRGRLRRRRPCLRRARPKRARQRRPLRPPRPRRDPGRNAEQGDGRPRRVRRRLADAARDARPARPPVPLLDVAPARRHGGLPRRDPRARGRAGADRAALVEHAPVQGGARRASASTPASRRRRSRR